LGKTRIVEVGFYLLGKEGFGGKVKRVLPREKTLRKEPLVLDWEGGPEPKF